MSGGKTPKRRGKSFEYRVRDFLVNRRWSAIVIPLSGASVSITKEMGGHDVRASYKKTSITLECKKTAGQSMAFQYKWLERLKRDEYLVFALQRTDIYVVLPLSGYCKIFGNILTGISVYKELHLKSHRLPCSKLEQIPLLFVWCGQVYIIVLLKEMASKLEEAEDIVYRDSLVKRITE